MSLQFSDLNNLKGIVQIYEKEIGANPGDVSGNVQKLKAFTADANLALDDYLVIALKSSGTWQFDDSNHTDYPIIRTDIISGQRDYTFVEDQSGNLILDIYKVVVTDSTGYGREIYPIDAQSTDQNVSFYDTSSFYNNQNATGTPLFYDKTANGIFLGYIPNFSRSKALEVYINRETSYFTYTDTIKKPGVPGIHHKYFALKPALDYARRNNLAVLPRLEAEVLKLEGDEDKGITGSIARYFGRRERDIPRRMVPANDRQYFPMSGRL